MMAETWRAVGAPFCQRYKIEVQTTVKDCITSWLNFSEGNYIWPPCIPSAESIGQGNIRFLACTMP